jgi:hypothetical protein
MTSFTSGTRDLIQMLSGYGKLILMIVALSLSIATDLNASSAYCGSGPSPKAVIAKAMRRHKTVRVYLMRFFIFNQR